MEKLLIFGQKEKTYLLTLIIQHVPPITQRYSKSPHRKNEKIEHGALSQTAHANRRQSKEMHRRTKINAKYAGKENHKRRGEKAL